MRKNSRFFDLFRELLMDEICARKYPNFLKYINRRCKLREPGTPPPPYSEDEREGLAFRKIMKGMESEEEFFEFCRRHEIIFPSGEDLRGLQGRAAEFLQFEMDGEVDRDVRPS